MRLLRSLVLPLWGSKTAEWLPQLCYPINRALDIGDLATSESCEPPYKCQELRFRVAERPDVIESGLVVAHRAL